MSGCVVHMACCGARPTFDAERLTCCDFQFPKDGRREPACGTHLTRDVILLPRCAPHQAVDTQQRTFCGTPKTACGRRQARGVCRIARYNEREARPISQRTGNRPCVAIFYIEYKPLVPTPLALGVGGLVRSWQEIGMLTSKCHAAAD